MRVFSVFNPANICWKLRRSWGRGSLLTSELIEGIISPLLTLLTLIPFHLFWKYPEQRKAKSYFRITKIQEPVNTAYGRGSRASYHEMSPPQYRSADRLYCALNFRYHGRSVLHRVSAFEQKGRERYVGIWPIWERSLIFIQTVLFISYIKITSIFIQNCMLQSVLLCVTFRCARLLRKHFFRTIYAYSCIRDV